MKNKNHVPIAVAPSRAARDFLLCLGAFFLFSLSLYLSVSLLVSDRVLRLILGPAPTSGSPWSTMAARYRGHNAAAIPLSLSEWRLNGPGSPPRFTSFYYITVITVIVVIIITSSSLYRFVYYYYYYLRVVVFHIFQWYCEEKYAVDRPSRVVCVYITPRVSPCASMWSRLLFFISLD